MDLDGSLPGAETILVSDAINLLAGDYSLSFQIAGNQRGGASDTVSVSVEVGLLSSTSFTLSPNDGFRIETLGFSVLSDTNANIRFLHAGPLDNVGILLDWVKLEGDPIDPVPVPASLPLLAGGFALFGALGMRRKKKA